MGAAKARGSLSPSQRPAGAQRSPWLRRRLASDIGEDVVSGGRAKGRLWPRLSQLNLSNLGARLLQVHFEITACFCLEAMGAVGQRERQGHQAFFYSAPETQKRIPGTQPSRGSHSGGGIAGNRIIHR